MSTVTVSLSGLGDVHATVASLSWGDVDVAFAHPGGSVTLSGGHDKARLLLTDALAQLDAIAAQHTDEDDQ